MTTIPPDAILNPYTPLAFLPPDAADQYQVVSYVYVATLAAFTWDWLMAIPEEYQIICKQGFGLPNVAYFISRFGTFGYCLSTTMYRIMSIDNCTSLKYVEQIFFVIGGPATSLLFFLRVRAVYNRSRIITAFFGILWLGITGTSILITIGTTDSHIPYTRRCIEGLAPIYTTVPIILTAVNDTLVFLAISYRMVFSAMVRSTWRARARSFFTGEGLHQLSKALLQSGQVYYFVTIGVAITWTALILSPSIPGQLHPILGSAYFALANAMACRVFRAVLLESIKDPQTNPTKLGSFHRPNADTRDVKPSRSSKLDINVVVKTATAAESNDWYPLSETKLTGDGMQPEDAFHSV